MTAATFTVIYNSDLERFEFANLSRAERSVAKDAGFRFDWDTKLWYSTDCRHAKRVAHYATDPAVVSRIDAGLTAAIIDAKPRLTFDSDSGIFTAHCEFALKDKAKAAGFKWDKAQKKWATKDINIAAALIDWAEGSVKRKLNKAIKAKTKTLELSRASTFDASKLTAPPNGLAYLPYQRAGIAFGMSRDAVLIGDEMGLGKTIQAIGIINESPKAKRILIISPASLRLNWKRECEKWLVNSDLTIEIATTKAAFPTTNIVIINYDILAKPAIKAGLDSVKWDILISDECHYLKNAKAQRTMAVVGGIKKTPAKKKNGKVIAKATEEKIPAIRAKKRVLLTGTPIPNRPIELWTVANYLAPTAFDSFWDYARGFCNAHQTRWGWEMNGASNMEGLQDKLRSTVMVRRLKADVLTELPAKIRQVVVMPANGAAKAVKAEQKSQANKDAIMLKLQAEVELAKARSDEEYEMAVMKLKDAGQIAFCEIAAKRRETSVAKAPYVVQHCLDAMEGNDKKIVVMAHHHDVVDALMAGFKKAKAKAVKLTGKDAMEDRQASVDSFQNDPDTKVFVGTIKAAGVGITLTAASHVIFAELSYVPADISQAEDRCHRISQKDTVLVQHLVLDGSIDSRMAQTLISKQGVIDSCLDTEHDLTQPEMDVSSYEAMDISPVYLDEEIAKAIAEAEAAKADEATRRAAAKRAETLQRKKDAMRQRSSRDEVIAIAMDMTPEKAALVHQGLQEVSGYCDYAREKDGAGFNKVDAYVANHMARSLTTLNNREAALGYLYCRKYQRQIGGELLIKLGITKA